MKLVFTVALTGWFGVGVGAAADDYTGNWWMIWVAIMATLVTLCALYLRRPKR